MFVFNQSPKPESSPESGPRLDYEKLAQLPNDSHSNRGWELTHRKTVQSDARRLAGLITDHPLCPTLPQFTRLPDPAQHSLRSLWPFAASELRLLQTISALSTLEGTPLSLDPHTGLAALPNLKFEQHHNRLLLDQPSVAQSGAVLKIDAGKLEDSPFPIVIQIKLDRIEFDNAQWFTVEDMLARQMCSEVGRYHTAKSKQKEQQTRLVRLRRHSDERVKRVKRHTEAVKKNHSRVMVDQLTSSRLSCIDTLDQLLECRKGIDQLEKEANHWLCSVCQTWRQLQNWRHDRGPFGIGVSGNSTLYNGQPLKLILQETHVNVQRERQIREKALKQELAESTLVERMRHQQRVFEQRQGGVNTAPLGQPPSMDFIRSSIVTRKQQCLPVLSEDTQTHCSQFTPFVQYLNDGLTDDSFCNTRERFRRAKARRQTFQIQASNAKDSRVLFQVSDLKLTFPDNSINLGCEMVVELFDEAEIPVLNLDIQLNRFLWIKDTLAKVELDLKSELASPEGTESHSGQLKHVSFHGLSIPNNHHMSVVDFNTYVKPVFPDASRQTHGKLYYSVNCIKKSKIQARTELNEGENPNPIEVVTKLNPTTGIREEIVIKAGEPIPSLQSKAVRNERSQTEIRQQLLKMRRMLVIKPGTRIPFQSQEIPIELYDKVYEYESDARMARKSRTLFVRSRQARKDVSELVRETQQSLDWSTLTWFLKPKRRLRGAIDLHTSSDQSFQPMGTKLQRCQLLATIERASNLSARRQHRARALAPYVELSFSGHSTRTQTSEGINPRWDETLTLPFTIEAETIAPSVYQSIKEDIRINVFDEYTVECETDDFRQTESKLRRTERRWIGGLSIPFSTLFLNNCSIQGHFQIQVPISNLGYNSGVPLTSSFIWLFLTIDPRIPRPKASEHTSHVDSIEGQCFHELVQRWFKSSVKCTPFIRQSEVDLFVSDSQDNPVLITKFLRPLEPPMRVSQEVFIRFVSCIPFEEDSHAFSGSINRDVWTTSSEFLDLGYGDWEEHANLLACFFLWLDSQSPQSGWETYVCIGKGIPEGDTVYVLRRNVSVSGVIGKNEHINSVVLYNAATGIRYDVPETSGNWICPLQDISVVFSQTQVWLNIQNPQISVHPASAQFSYHFHDPKAWKALFTPKTSKLKALERQIQPIQPESLIYAAINPDYLESRTRRLERIIESRIEHWRSQKELQTRWNYSVCATLRETLETLEHFCQNGGFIAAAPDKSEIMAIRQIYPFMYGFPLYITDSGVNDQILECSDDNPLVSLVKNTKVHQSENQDVEFARAVYLYPYTNNICTIWVYIASLSSSPA